MSELVENKHKIMDGALLAKNILKKIASEIEENIYNPRLAAILVGDDIGAITYQKFKERKCAEVGIRYSLYAFQSTELASVKAKITELNEDDDITGIMVQLPIPEGWDEDALLEHIVPNKDVDGLNYENVGRSYYSSHSDVFVPCAAEGIMRLLAKYQVDMEGKKAAVLGRGRLLGTPVAQLLEKKNAFVTKIHSIVDRERLEHELKTADIVISATGKPEIIEGRFLREGVIAIDCGNTANEREFKEDMFDRSSLFSTVPGGVGPMTIAVLLNNVLKAYKMQKVA